ncbi:MAG: helix-hairpin-helix domain-containing protein [Methanosphaera stadtmanae]|nr:helix-hairpin-helix domain-containing protein [Methanosphaera stadtmanae]
MKQNFSFWKIINLFWILLIFIPFFNGLGFIYAGWRVNETKWIDEGIFYMIPFIFLSFTVINNIIIYSALLLLIIGIIRAFMIVQPFLKKLEEKNSNVKDYSIQYNGYQNKKIDRIPYNNEIIDVNNANIQELKKISFLNESKINNIIELRKQGYVFNSMEDFSQKLDLSQSEMKDLEKYIKINKVSNSRKLDI